MLFVSVFECGEKGKNGHDFTRKMRKRGEKKTTPTTFFEKFYARFFELPKKLQKAFKKVTLGVIFFTNSNALKVDENGEIVGKNGLKKAFFEVFWPFLSDLMVYWRVKVKNIYKE